MPSSSSEVVRLFPLPIANSTRTAARFVGRRDGLEVADFLRRAIASADSGEP